MLSSPASMARPCAGHPRSLPPRAGSTVDGRDKPGHDVVACSFLEDCPAHAPSPDLHGHARFLRADAARARRAWPRDRRRLHPRAEAGRAARPAIAADPGGRSRAKARHPRADAEDAEDTGGTRRIPRVRRRCCGRRRLRHDPAAGHSRCAEARLLQSARLAAAALARRRADQPRHHGRRRRERRDGDEDGCRPRYRRRRHGRAHRDHGQP